MQARARREKAFAGPSFDIEMSQRGVVAGIDEAGRGPWAGPVVAAAVILDPENIPAGVGISSVEEIDKINILQATFLAMARAEAGLAHQPDVCIVDGSQKPKLTAHTHMVVKGDALSFSIAAASIIAKTVRDQIMRELACEHPFYAWENNKGYGAPAHREGLERHGVTPHHRKSFAPIRALCQIAGRDCSS